MKQITSFWNWFQKNEREIINAFFLGINSDAICIQFSKKLQAVSKRIGFEISQVPNDRDRFLLLFTGAGYRKLFPKIIALEKQAPPLEHFLVQAFLQPMEDLENYKDGSDAPLICENHEIKISEVQIALLDYNIATKKIKINLYLPDYNEIKNHQNLCSDIDWIVMMVLGEIAFRKHIKEIHLRQMPLEPKGLLALIELPNLIAYLHEINSRKKTRMV